MQVGDRLGGRSRIDSIVIPRTAIAQEGLDECIKSRVRPTVAGREGRPDGAGESGKCGARATVKMNPRARHAPGGGGVRS